MVYKHKSIIFVIILAVITSLVCGCNNNVAISNKQRYITIIDSNHFSVQNKVVSVDDDNNVQFDVNLNDNYYIESVSYADSEIINISISLAIVKLFNVKYSQRVELNCLKRDATIVYHLNGGEFLNENEMFSDSYFVSYAKTKHIRINTELGTNKIFKKDYTQIGWNTKADGSGEHIGLGSRVSVVNERLDLYASWLKNTPFEAFYYSDYADGVSINGIKSSYLSLDEKDLVIPSLIDDKKVVKVSTNAFINTAIERLVLPITLKTIEPQAVRGGSVHTIYFFDALEEIEDSSFYNCNELKTVRINAVLQPMFIAVDRHSNTADKYDILIENADKKKLVFFSGSSGYFSVDTKQIETAFPEYVAINMAVNGWFSGVAQTQIIATYLKEDDIFIHAPEIPSRQQLMLENDFLPASNAETNSLDLRFFKVMEANYDLLSLVDIRTVKGFLSGYSLYFKARETTRNEEVMSGRPLNTKYSDCVDPWYIDERGNYSLSKPMIGEDKILSNEAEIILDYVLAFRYDGLLVKHYEMLENKGISVLVTNAPINGTTLKDKYGDNYINMAYQFDSQMYLLLPSRFPILVKLVDCIYQGSVFFNSDFHLSDEGTVVHTNKIINAIKNMI